MLCKVKIKINKYGKRFNFFYLKIFLVVWKKNYPIKDSTTITGE